MADDAHPDGLRCPSCRSTNVVCHGRPHGHECNDCGYDGTTPDPLAQALAVLRSHSDVCSRHGESARLRAEADRIEALAATMFDQLPVLLPGEPVPDDAGVAAGPQVTQDQLQRRYGAWHSARFPDAEAVHSLAKATEELGELAAALVAHIGVNAGRNPQVGDVPTEAADLVGVLLVMIDRWWPSVDLLLEVERKLAVLEDPSSGHSSAALTVVAVPTDHEAQPDAD